ncbi:MAG: replicative DNA helicase [Candidatus Kapabacteria bacterium]|nr:replicative DNA helicase [Candidatus Kapabacteria bacterium]MDW8012499.1 replicative DNA helicase [Bacteroidota bacterium]
MPLQGTEGAADYPLEKFLQAGHRRTAEVIPLERLTERVPPHSVEAEMAVLGAMLLDRSALAKGVELLQPDCFYREAHQLLFAAMVSLFERGATVDALTVAEELRRRGLLERVGGTAYIAELTLRVPSVSAVEYYARIVLEHYIKRSLIRAAAEILYACYDDSTDALEELDRAESAIFEIAEKRLQQTAIPMRSLARTTFEVISHLMERGSRHGVTGIPTGYVRLDELLGGLQRSDFIVIAGRPSMGKTALALSIARNVAVEYRVPVAIFSLEMSAQQLALRLLAAEAQIDLHRLRTGRISPEQLSKIVQATGRLADAPIFVDDTPMLSLLELRAKSRRLRAEHNVQLVIVDYLQLVHPPKAESREREVALISRSLKMMAKELNIPVVALAQLNRAVESRADKRPMLADLRESGSLEQDADVVIFIHRPEMYGITTYDDGTPTEGTAEIIVGKQRNGPVGEVRLAYLRDFARFENLALHYPEPPPPPYDADTPF